MKFAAKLNTLTIVLLMICTATLAGISWYLLEQEVQRSQSRYANQLGEQLLSNPDVAVGLQTGELEPVIAYFNDVIKNQKGVRFIALIKADGTFLVDTSQGEAEKMFAWRTLLADSGTHTIRGIVKRDLIFRGISDDLYLAQLPLFSQGNLWGHAALGFSFKELYRETLPKVFMLLMGLWLGLAGVSSLILFGFVHSLTHPIRDLTQGVQMLTTGHFDYPMNITSRDELGALATLFDQMRQSLRETFNRLQKLSSMDEITHLYNQSFFNTLLEQELARARRYKYPLVLVLIRLDNFDALKQGHRGDLKPFLLQMTRALQKCIRNTDNLARYQDHTFAMVLSQSDRKGSQPVIDRIQSAMNEIQNEGASSSSPAPSASIGLAVVEAGEVVSAVDQLIIKAEKDLKKLAIGS